MLSTEYRVAEWVRQDEDRGLECDEDTDEDRQALRSHSSHKRKRMFRNPLWLRNVLLDIFSVLLVLHEIRIAVLACDAHQQKSGATASVGAAESSK